MIMGHAKFSAEHLSGGHLKAITPQRNAHPKNARSLKRTSSSPLMLTFPEQPTAEQEKEENEDTEVSGLLTDSNGPLLLCYPEPNEISEVGLLPGTPQNEEGEDEEDEEDETEAFNEEEEAEEPEESLPWWSHEDSELPIQQAAEEPTDEQFVPPEIEEFLNCEENTIQSINEAIDLFEAVKHAQPGHFLQFINHARATRVRMLVEYTIPEGSDAENLSIIKASPLASEIFIVPEEARFIQVHFEYSTAFLPWRPICAYHGYSHTFAYASPATRRFFVVGFADKIHLSQVRDEYEQLVTE